MPRLLWRRIRSRSRKCEISEVSRVQHCRFPEKMRATRSCRLEILLYYVCAFCANVSCLESPVPLPKPNRYHSTFKKANKFTTRSWCYGYTSSVDLSPVYWGGEEPPFSWISASMAMQSPRFFLCSLCWRCPYPAFRLMLVAFAFGSCTVSASVSVSFDSC